MDKLHIYAPGDGTLAFVWREDNRRNFTKPVTEQDVINHMAENISYMKCGNLINLRGQFILVDNIERINETMLRISDGRVITYDENCVYGFVPDIKERYNIINNSVILSVRFFLANEEELKTAKRINVPVSQHIGYLWTVQATIYVEKDGYKSRIQIPTFIFNGNVQGFSTEEMAIKIAKEIVNPTNDPKIETDITVVPWIKCPN